MRLPDIYNPFQIFLSQHAYLLEVNIIISANIYKLDIVLDLHINPIFKREDSILSTTYFFLHLSSTITNPS